MMRWATTADPGRFQSSGSTSQRMILKPNSLRDPEALARREGAVGRAHEDGLVAGGVDDGVLGFLDFRADGVVAHLGEIGDGCKSGCRPGDPQPLALDELRVARGVLADEEERELDVLFRREIEEAIRVIGGTAAGAIVERHCDIRSIDVAAGEGDLRADGLRGVCGSCGPGDDRRRNCGSSGNRRGSGRR